MKTIKVTSIPKCDLCGDSKGVYDGPIMGIGSMWGNFCEKCFDSKVDKVGVQMAGSKRELIIVAEKSDDPKIYIAKELTDLISVLSEMEDRELECPRCGETRSVEVDFRGQFQCSGCGRQLKAEALI